MNSEPVNATSHLYSRPVFPLLLSIISGILLGFWFPCHDILVYPVIILCLCLLFYNIIKKKIVFIWPILLFSALGYLSIQPWIVPNFPSNHIINFANSNSWKIVGIIDDDPIKYKNRLRFILRAETLGEYDSSFPVTGKIRVTVTGNCNKLSIGDRITFSGKIKLIRNFKNPGGFDYKRYMSFKGIWGTTYVKGGRLTVLKRDSRKGIRFVIEDARIKISDLIEKTTQEKEKEVLKALIVGDRNGISRDLRKVFNRAGVGHLLAISGLHIGIVATVSFILFSWMLSHFKLFLRNAWTRKGAAALSLIPVFLYGLLAGMSPSTQRAVIMVSVFLMTFWIKREHDPINTLAVAALLILIFDPPSLFSISFQLSFIAVLSIIYGMSRIPNNNAIKRKGRFSIKNKLFSLFLVSFFAIIGNLPLIMLYFNQVSTVGLAANFIIVPLIGFIVVPLGLISVFLYPVSIFGASICFKANAFILAKILEIVDLFSDLPFAAVKTLTPTYFEICCFYILCWAILNLTGQSTEGKTQGAELRGEKNTPFGKFYKLFKQISGNKPVFRKKLPIIVIVLVIFAGGADACYWLYNRFWHDDLRVTIIDVGQGSAGLLELPGGFILLIDGGGFSDNSTFDVGERIIAPFLWRRKVKTVDTLILSHPNSDHLNGLLYIAEHFNVKNIWTNNESTDTLGYHKFMEIIEKDKINLPEFKDILRTHNISGVQLKILYPPNDFIYKKKKDRWRNRNNNSLVVKAEFGSKSFLFPGDIMTGAERELVAIAGDNLKSTVLIAPHHGSKTSSTVSFLNKVKPEYVIISSGWKNSFRFPHPSIVKRYKERGYGVFRTDSHGALTMSTDGRSLIIRPCILDPSCPG